MIRHIPVQTVRPTEPGIPSTLTIGQYRIVHSGGGETRAYRLVDGVYQPLGTNTNDWQALVHLFALHHLGAPEQRDEAA